MEVWVPYEKVRNLPPDFSIKYLIYSEEEGGKSIPCSRDCVVILHMTETTSKRLAYLQFILNLKINAEALF